MRETVRDLALERARAPSHDLAKDGVVKLASKDLRLQPGDIIVIRGNILNRRWG